MKKKIFKVIGIVLASVFGFTGAVLGVMALMGKFKTPDVYPDVLVFEQNEIVVVDEYIALDKYEKSDLYYFTLTGVTNNEEYADIGVNQTTCYIWFADDEFNNNVGSNLITLCDADGNPLTKITDINDKNYNRYKVDCNSPIYFKINSLLDKDGNEISSIANLDGKVLIHARHENEMVATSTPLTIWIDRKVNSMSLAGCASLAEKDGTKNALDEDNYKQSVTIGAGSRKDFEYIINPEKARHPISVQNGKIIELYIVDPSKTDYVKLTPEKFIEGDGVDNDLSEYVYNVVKYDEENEKFYIETSLTDVAHNFKIAVFPTYQAKLDYEAKPESLTHVNWQRVDNMLVTSLAVNVVNSNVTRIELDTHSVGLGLYSENDYVSLNGSSGLNDVKNNNLGLVMYKGTESTDLRYDEAKFADYKFTSISDWSKLEFVNKESGEIKKFENLFKDESNAVKTSNIFIKDDAGNKYEIIDHITNDGDEYYCKNGVLIRDVNKGSYNILKSGTYLDFFTYDGEKFTSIQSELNEQTQVRTYGTFEDGKCIDQCFIVNRKINSKGNSSWNIIATKEITATEDIRLGVLVINSDGTFSVENFFKTTSVVVEVRDLTYSIDPNAHTLNIYHNTGVPVCDYMDFEDIVYELVGSYDAVVFAVEAKNAGGNYIIPSVEVLWKDEDGDSEFDVDTSTTEGIIIEHGGKEYYIVGNVENVNGGAGYDKFNNVVKIKDVNNSSSIILELIQFKNSYKESTENIVLELINNETAPVVNKVISTDTVTIIPKQNLDAEQLNYTYSSWDETNKRVNAYENTEGYTIQISSANANMLKKVFDFYGLGTLNGNNFNDYIKSADSRVQITGVTYPEKDAYIEIAYNATNKLISEQGIYIIISGVGTYIDANKIEQNVVIELGPIYINQSTPDNIAYISGEDKILLASKDTDAKASSAVLNIVISGTNYTPTLSLTDGVTTIGDGQGEKVEFNTQTIKDKAGFQDAKGHKVDHSVKYTSLNTNIFTIDEDGTGLTAISAGVGVLKVTIADSVDAFLKVEIKGDGNYQFKVGESVVNAGNQTPAYYKHTYTGSAFTLNKDEENNNNFAALIYDTDKDKDYEKETNNLMASTTGVNITNAECNYYGNGIIDVKETTDGILFTTATGEETLNIYKDGTPEKWTFVRETNKYVPITVTFDVVTKVGTIKIQLEITSNITAQFNEEFWQTNTIYAETTVLVYENKTDIAKFTKNALISVKTADSNNVVKIEINKEDGSNEKIIASANGVDGAEVTYQYNFANVAKYNLVVYVDNSKITSFAFNVVPNVVAYDNNTDATTANNYELKSDTTYDITKVFTLKYFDSDKVYGSGNNSYYDANKKLAPQNIYGAEGKLNVPTNLVVSSNLKQENNANADLITTSGTQFTIGWVSDLNAYKIAPIQLKYGDFTFNFDSNGVSSNNKNDNNYITATIINKYEPIIDYQEISTKRLLMALTEYNPFVIVREFKGEATLDDATNPTKITFDSTDYTDDDYDGKFKAINKEDYFVWNSFTSTLTYFLNSEVMGNICTIDGTKGIFYQSGLKNVSWQGNSILTSGLVYVNAIFEPKYNQTVKYEFVTAKGNLYCEISGFTILPYLPERDKQNAYSEEEEYDLLTDIFAIIDADKNILVSDEVASIIVDGVYADSDRTQPLTEVVTGSFGVGYTKGVNNPDCDVTLNAFEGDSKIVYVGYTITYIGVEGSYSFTEELTIQNRQSITLNYPEQDENLGFENIAFKFHKDKNVDYSADGKFLSGSDTLNADNVYGITAKNGTYTKQYAERILISDKPTVISFKDDNIKYINRVNIIDRNTSVVGNPYVVPIAYETQTDFDNFFNGIEINPEDRPWEVTLPEATAGTHGYIIFKVFTASGNYVYYYVYVFCADETGVKADSNLIVNATSGSLATNLVGVSDSLIDEDDFKTEFGKEYNDSSISFYITDAYELTKIALSIDPETYKYGYNKVLGAYKYKKLDYNNLKSTLNSITNYRTITISVLFNNGGAEVYGIGTITLIVRPSTNEGEPNPSNLEKFGLVDFGLVEADKTNGEYKAIITNNTTTVNCPFGSGYTIVNNEDLDTNKVGINKKYDETSGDKIDSDGSMCLTRVEDDYTFTVFYEKGNLILKVTYTYQQTTFARDKTVSYKQGEELGSFDEDSNKFIKTYKLTSDLLGNYEGEIKLGEKVVNFGTKVSSSESNKHINDDVEFYINGTELWLQFKLKFNDYSAVVPITFVESNKTATLTFPVRKGVHSIEENSSGKGLDSNKDNRLKTEYKLKDGSIDYTQAIGSKLKVDETKINDNDNDNVYKYSIGGLTVYTYKQVANLEVLISDTSISNEEDQIPYLITNSGMSRSTNSKELNFVHLADNKNLKMELSLKDGENVFLKQTMYITVQKTYENLIAQYVTTDADHENVVSGTKIPNIYNYLFNTTISTINFEATGEGTITNNLRIALVVGYNADKTPILAESVTFGTTSSVGMGFAMENNPNKISFKFENIELSESLDFGGFHENVNANTPVTLYISNNAGVDGVGYKFQIVPEVASTADGKKLTDTITYSNDYGYVGDNYISFTEWLKTNEKGTSEAKELTIGTLNDGLNDKSFYLTDKKVYISIIAGVNTYDGNDSLVSSGYTKVKFNNVLYEIKGEDRYKLNTTSGLYEQDNLGTYLLLDSSVELEILETSKTYTLSVGSLKLELIYNEDTNEDTNKDTKVLTCKLISGVLEDKDQLIFTISLFGTTNYIAENFRIVFTKLNVTGPVTTDSVDADTYINLIDDKKINLSDGVNKEDIELVLNTTSSYYTVTGNTKNVTSNSTNLFMYNQSNKAIQLDQVGNEPVVAYLMFDVKYKGIYISQVEYNFEVKCNLLVVVNGDTVGDKVKTLQTEFHLTKEKDADKVFPLTYSFAPSLTNLNNEIEDKFSELVINLYKRSTKTPLGLSYLTFKLSSDHSDAVAIDDANKTITFYKDLTDYIEIEVTIDSDLLNGNGKYITTWGIDVKGIIDFDGLAEDSKDRLKVDGTTAYSSSDAVEIVNIVKDYDTAISMNRNTVFTPSESHDNVDVSIQGKYVESNTTNDDLSNYDIFNKTFTDADGKVIDNSLNAQEFTIVKTSSRLTINLPYLESGKTYIVVYKVTFTYLSLGTATGTKTETFYVAYMVKNNVAITENIFKEGTGSSEKTYYGGKVDMDDTNRLIADNSATATTETGAYLDLFYYSEIWKNGEDEYILTYAGDYTEIWSDNQSSESKYKLKYNAITKTYSVTKEDGNEGGYYNATDGKVYTAENGTACTKISTIYDYIVTKKDDSAGGFYNEANGKVYTSEGGMLCTKESSNTYYPNTTTYSVFDSSFNNIVAYKDFIDKALNGYVAISDSKNNQGYYFKVESLGSGRFGINLKDGYSDSACSEALEDKAFVKNELVGDLVVYVDNAPVVTLPAYNEQTKQGFMLHTSNKLSPVGSVEHTISSMFMDSEIGSIATGYDLNKIKDIRVLGIVNKDATTANIGWVIYPDGSDDDTDPDNATSRSLGSAIATISVENGSGSTTYTLHPVIYSGTAGNGKIYTLEETFYVLKTSTSEAKIAVRDYGNGSSIVSFRFRVAYAPVANGYVSLDTSKAFRLYKMKDNALTYTTPNEIDSTTGEITKTNYTPIYREITSTDADDYAIKIHKDKLIAYKATHQDEINYPAEYKVNIGGTVGEGGVITGGINVKVYVQFILPTSVTPVNYNATKSEITIDVSSLNITLDTGVTITEITSANTTCDGEKIKLLATSMYDCFEYGNKLYIEELTLELSNGKDLTYYVVILDSRTLNYYTKSGVAPINGVIDNNTATFDVNNTPTDSSDDASATLEYINGVITKVTFNGIEYEDIDGDFKFTASDKEDYFVLEHN